MATLWTLSSQRTFGDKPEPHSSLGPRTAHDEIEQLRWGFTPVFRKWDAVVRFGQSQDRYGTLNARAAPMLNSRPSASSTAEVLRRPSLARPHHDVPALDARHMQDDPMVLLVVDDAPRVALIRVVAVQASMVGPRAHRF